MNVEVIIKKLKILINMQTSCAQTELLTTNIVPQIFKRSTGVYVWNLTLLQDGKCFTSFEDIFKEGLERIKTDERFRDPENYRVY